MSPAHTIKGLLSKSLKYCATGHSTTNITKSTQSLKFQEQHKSEIWTNTHPWTYQRWDQVLNWSHAPLALISDQVNGITRRQHQCPKNGFTNWYDTHHRAFDQVESCNGKLDRYNQDVEFPRS